MRPLLRKRMSLVLESLTRLQHEQASFSPSYVPNYSYSHWEFPDPVFIDHFRAGLETALRDLTDYRERIDTLSRRFLEFAPMQDSTKDLKQLDKTVTSAGKLLDQLKAFEDQTLDLIAEIDKVKKYG